jgi:hypothetical protein
MAQHNKNTKRTSADTKKSKEQNMVVTGRKDAKGKEKGIVSFLLAVSIGFAIVAAVIAYTDYKGYFNPDYLNDHTRRKWKSFYKLTTENKQPVDVVLVGNSHLYTGLNPENLSNALGVTAFILASPGTTLTDSYFCLKEAIKVHKPRIAVVETFTISDYVTRELKDGVLSDQFKSFSARKSFSEKLFSTPVLFSSENYLSAWSSTIRNHNFLFTDTAQIRQNIYLMKNPVPEDSALYLGRYIRFTSGLEADNLRKYDDPDFVGCDYASMLPGKEAAEYLRKTITLCDDNNIELVFLTLPMYYKHVRNYEAYKQKITEIISGAKVHWLDLQKPYDTLAFTPESFENTLSKNQHMTLHGSLIAAYKLAGYIHQQLPKAISDRSSDVTWKRLFYNSTGYFENYSPENDGVNKILLKNAVTSEGLKIKEVDFVRQDNNMKLLVKIENDSRPLKKETLTVVVEAKLNGNIGIFPIEVKTTPAYQPLNHKLFVSTPLITQLEILNVRDIQ